MIEFDWTWDIDLKFMGISEQLVLEISASQQKQQDTSYKSFWIKVDGLLSIHNS